MTKETGLPFQDSLVRAILDGSKVRTRRIVSHPPLTVEVCNDWFEDGKGGECSRQREGYFPAVIYTFDDETSAKIDWFRQYKAPYRKSVRRLQWNKGRKWYSSEAICSCPYGGVGDRIWVREAWCHTGSGVWSIGDAALARDGQVAYRATDDVICDTGVRWWPSIHMPRWACRTVLPITSLSLERVQDITEQEALEEGMSNGDQFETARDEFRFVWDSIYEARGLGWIKNPWVWNIGWKQETLKENNHGQE